MASEFFRQIRTKHQTKSSSDDNYDDLLEGFGDRTRMNTISETENMRTSNRLSIGLNNIRSSIVNLKQRASDADVNDNAYADEDVSLQNGVERNVNASRLSNLKDKIQSLRRENEHLKQLVQDQSKAMKKYGKIFDPAANRIQRNKKRLDENSHNNSNLLTDEDIEQAAYRSSEKSTDLMNVGNVDDTHKQFFATSQSSRFSESLNNNRFMRIIDSNNRKSMRYRETVYAPKRRASETLMEDMNIGRGAAQAVINLASILESLTLRDLLNKHQQQLNVEPTDVFGQFNLLTIPLDEQILTDHESSGVDEEIKGFKILDVSVLYIRFYTSMNVALVLSFIRYIYLLIL